MYILKDVSCPLKVLEKPLINIVSGYRLVLVHGKLLNLFNKELVLE